MMTGTWQCNHLTSLTGRHGSEIQTFLLNLLALMFTKILPGIRLWSKCSFIINQQSRDRDRDRPVKFESIGGNHISWRARQWNKHWIHGTTSKATSSVKGLN